MKRSALVMLAGTAPLTAASQPPEPPPGAIFYPPIEQADTAPFAIVGTDRHVLVGKPNNSSQGFDEFAVVFDRLTAEQLYVFEPERPRDTGGFGGAVALWNDLAFVAGRADDKSGVDRGFVDVFDLTTGERINTLSAPMPEGRDWFGFNLAVAGDRLAVGDVVAGWPGTDSGRISVYSLPDFALLYEITDTNTTDELFPLYMDMSEDHIVAVNGLADDLGNRDNTFLVFDAETGALLAEANPVVEGETVTDLQGAVAVDGRYALVSDLGSDRAESGAGEVYVFDLDQMAFVNAFTPPPNSVFWNFGASIAMKSDVAVIGMPQNSIFGERGLIGIVRIPSGEILRLVRAFEWDGRDFFDIEQFGQGVALAANGVAVSSRGSFEDEALVNWIPLPELCPADTNRDGLLGPVDYGAWIVAFNDNDPACDQNGDGECTAADFAAWILNFNAGC